MPICKSKTSPATLSSRKLFFSAACVAFVFSAASAREEDPPASATAGTEFDDRLQEGLRALYSLDYDRARATFRLFIDEFPHDPVGPYAMTTTDWWELTNEFDEKNPELEDKFLGGAWRTAELSRRRIREGDTRGEAHLCLGGALGLISRWDAIQGKWLAAYRHGKQAFNAQKKALEINPRLYDAYLGVGMFHYYTATLPHVVKILAKLIFGGNKEQGLKEIRWAMEKGRFSRTAAQLFLVGIYNNTEKDYAAALDLVRAGRREFPHSSFFHFVEMLTLENARDWTSLRREAHDFLFRIDRKEPSYRTKYRHRAYLALGNSYFGEGKPAEALENYNRAIHEFPAEDRWLTWTHLCRGKAFDLLGERDKALADYRTVLKRRNVWGLHDQAEDYIEKPYRAS